MPVKKIVLEVDDLDFHAIQNAMARRQSFRVMPDADGGNIAGRVIAEICRGWLERLDADKKKREDKDKGSGS